MADNEPCPLCENPVKPGMLLRKSEAILACLEPFRGKKQEYLISLSLDSGYRLITRRIVTIGLLDTSLAHPREVFVGPLADRAASVIIAHNHPSGDVAPSNADITTTQQLVAAGILLGMPLRDHIIVAVGAHYSFKHHSLL